MAFAQLTYRESLRDIEACLRAHKTKLYLLGIRGIVARSTLADANEIRDWRIYKDFSLHLIKTARVLYAKDSFGIELDNTVYALDTTTIELCLALFPWARFRKTLGAVKLHTLLDLRGNTPAFIHITEGKVHEVNVLDILPFEAGSFYIMDRGFFDFSLLYILHQAQAFFGTSENAVKTQIWIAIGVYVLVAIVKKHLKSELSLYIILQILSLTLFEKMPLNQLIDYFSDKYPQEDVSNQLYLFDL